MNQIPLRDTVIHINLDNLAYNMKQIKAMVGAEVEVAAVVKADGYGHGALGIAPTLMDNGASLLAVATLSEALQLKEAYPHYPVLIMGLTPTHLLPHVIKLGIIQTIDTLEQGLVLNQLAEEQHTVAVVHLKCDTGFHRLGFPLTEEGLEQMDQLCSLPHLAVEGIYSHLVLKDQASDQLQSQQLCQCIQILEGRGHQFRYHHLADSIASVDSPELRMNLIRAGAIIYGLKGFHRGQLDIRQVLTFHTKLSHITTLSKGEGVSYDHLWVAPCDTRIGTIPVGYADGYPRNLRDKAQVLICGKLVPVIGVICMDQCMVDLTQVPEAELGTDVVLYGDGSDQALTIQDISQLADTNKNEIVARLSPRSPRIYLSKVKKTKE